MKLGIRLGAFFAALFSPGRRIFEREPEMVNAAGQPLKVGNHRANVEASGPQKRRDPNKRHRRV